MGAHGTLFQCAYHLGEDFTRIRLKDDLETIVIEGTGESSLSAAMEIQNGYDEPLHLIDEGYTFDLVAADCHSLDELKRKINEAENPGDPSN